jgi:hypothetical protein
MWYLHSLQVVCDTLALSRDRDPPTQSISKFAAPQMSAAAGWRCQKAPRFYRYADCPFPYHESKIRRYFLSVYAFLYEIKQAFAPCP